MSSSSCCYIRCWGFGRPFSHLVVQFQIALRHLWIKIQSQFSTRCYCTKPKQHLWIEIDINGPLHSRCSFSCVARALRSILKIQFKQVHLVPWSSLVELEFLRCVCHSDEQNVVEDFCPTGIIPEIEHFSWYFSALKWASSNSSLIPRIGKDPSNENFKTWSHWAIASRLQ